ncbi:MAG TPA: methyl-accepting chemotaxis protein [Bacteroidota bacterium]|nr:methyl-accepting chemotaxis protein [Bacteroidota bacterium]
MRTLADINTKTESGFLDVGARLQGVQRRVNGVTHDLMAIMGESTSEDGNSQVEGLRSIMVSANAFLSQFEASAASVADHLSHIELKVSALPAVFAVFGTKVSRLRMMGMTARIETARLGSTHLGFEYLADQVTALGETISTRTKEVQHSLRSIAEEIATSRDRLAMQRSDHHALLECVVKGVQSNLDTLLEKREALARGIEHITQKSRDAERALGQVVNAMQFQDITRQQLEHVGAALMGELQALEERPSDSLVDTALVCELQRVQLAQARTTFDEAINSIIASFNDLASTMSMVQEESRQALGFADATGKTFFDDIEIRLRDVMKTLGRGQEALRSIATSLSEIGETVRKVRSHGEDMGEVGTEIELLALNSRVRSARAGAQGAALGVIAEAIQRLSAETQDHIGSVVSILESLDQATREMPDETKGTHSGASGMESLTQMEGGLRCMIDGCHRQTALGGSVLTQTEAVCKDLGEELSAMTDVIRESRTFGNELSVVEESLRSLVAGFSIPESERHEVERKLHELQHQYTMDTERDIHAAYIAERSTGASAAPTQHVSSEGSIELF